MELLPSVPFLVIWTCHSNETDEISTSVPRFPLPSSRGTEPSFTWQRTNFLTGGKNLTGHFVHPEPFNIFALFTPNWRTRLNFNFFSVCGFTICPCAKRYFSRSKMAQSRPQCFHPLTRQTRRTFTRCRTNVDGSIRNLFIVFCWNRSRDNLVPGFPRTLHPWPSCAELWGRDCKMVHPCNYAFATHRFKR